RASHRCCTAADDYRYCLTSVSALPTTPEFYTLSLHDALPISHSMVPGGLLVTSRTTRLTSGTSLVMRLEMRANEVPEVNRVVLEDRKSTRLNSSHVKISYAVFCLKKKKMWTYMIMYCTIKSIM